VLHASTTAWSVAGRDNLPLQEPVSTSTQLDQACAHESPDLGGSRAFFPPSIPLVLGILVMGKFCYFFFFTFPSYSMFCPCELSFNCFVTYFQDLSLFLRWISLSYAPLLWAFSQTGILPFRSEFVQRRANSLRSRIRAQLVVSKCSPGTPLSCQKLAPPHPTMSILPFRSAGVVTDWL